MDPYKRLKNDLTKQHEKPPKPVDTLKLIPENVCISLYSVAIFSQKYSIQ